ncbi:MAG: protein kinase, partial [Candidatus Bathyarchaeia archaeon]
MGLFKSEKKEKGEKKGKKGRGGSVSQPPVLIQELKPEYTVIDEYWVQEPFAKVYIVMAPELGVGYHYFVDEVKLSPAEKEAHEKLISIISKELQAPETLDVDAAQYVLEEAKRLTLKYRRSIAKKLT